MLTDEQCDEFRRTPGTFNDMLRAVYDAGYQAAIEGIGEYVPENVKRYASAYA